MNKKYMKTIKLHYPSSSSHPYWQKNKYKVENNGVFLDPYKFWLDKTNLPSEYEISIDNKGIYVQYFACGSGYGKAAISDVFMLLKCNVSEIEFVGDPNWFK